MRLFFKLLRAVLGPFMLLAERIRRPKAIVRAPAAQVAVDEACSSLALYQFKTCPFCIKVRQEMYRLALPITLLDAQHDAQNRAALQQGTGATKVPCLRIENTDGGEQWLRESSVIVDYLRHRFGAATT